jgi:hypothetical protein
MNALNLPLVITHGANLDLKIQLIKAVQMKLDITVSFVLN